MGLPDPTPSSPLSSPSHSALHNAANDAVDKLGTGASVPAAGQVLTGTGPGTSEWSATVPPAAIPHLGAGASVPAAGQLLVGTGPGTSEWSGTLPAGAMPAIPHLGAGTSVPASGQLLVGTGSGTSEWSGTVPVAAVPNVPHLGDGASVPASGQLLVGTGPGTSAWDGAIPSKVGSGASTPIAGTVLTGTGPGTSAWQPAVGVTVNAITFPDTQVPNAGANVLDDYEEGSFTPEVTFATPGDLSIAYADRFGRYTKIGNRVMYGFSILTSVFTWTTAAGNFRIGGLPYVCSGPLGGGRPLGGGPISMSGWSTPAANASLAHVVQPGTSWCEVLASRPGVVMLYLIAAYLPSGGQLFIFGQGHYEAAS